MDYGGISTIRAIMSTIKNYVDANFLKKGAISGEDVTYDSSESHLDASTVQEAIDILAQGGGSDVPIGVKIAKVPILIPGTYFNTSSDTQATVTVDGNAESIIMYDLGSSAVHTVIFNAIGNTGNINRQRVCSSDIDFREVPSGTLVDTSRPYADGSADISVFSLSWIVPHRYLYIYLNASATAQTYTAQLLYT